jgi:hypothetical protein
MAMPTTTICNIGVNEEARSTVVLRVPNLLEKIKLCDQLWPP